MDKVTPMDGLSLEFWQERAGTWTEDRFPEADLRDRGLALGEEVGEVLRCILKAHQDIRGGSEFWLKELEKELADVFFTVVAMAHIARFDLNKAVEECWAKLKERQYTKGKVD